MPKHKKTRLEKKKADERNSAFIASTQQSHAFTTPSYSFSTQHVAKQTTTTKEHMGTTSTIVRHDLTKTLIISAVIVFLQLLFYFLLKNHVLAIRFVSY